MMEKIDNIGKPLCTGISKVATLCLWMLTHMIFLKKTFPNQVNCQDAELADQAQRSFWERKDLAFNLLSKLLENSFSRHIQWSVYFDDQSCQDWCM